MQHSLTSSMKVFTLLAVWDAAATVAARERGSLPRRIHQDELVVT